MITSKANSQLRIALAMMANSSNCSSAPSTKKIKPMTPAPMPMNEVPLNADPFLAGPFRNAKDSSATR
ncbi:hypothetical protein D3C80_1845900 [compost metagenome]